MDINYRVRKISIGLNWFLIVLGLAKGVFLYQYFSNILFSLSIIYTCVVTSFIGVFGLKTLIREDRYWIEAYIFLLFYLLFSTCLTPLETFAFYLIFYDIQAYTDAFKLDLVSVNVLIVFVLTALIPLVFQFKKELDIMKESEKHGGFLVEESHESL